MAHTLQQWGCRDRLYTLRKLRCPKVNQRRVQGMFYAWNRRRISFATIFIIIWTRTADSTISHIQRTNVGPKIYKGGLLETWSANEWRGWRRVGTSPTHIDEVTEAVKTEQVYSSYHMGEGLSTVEYVGLWGNQDRREGVWVDKKNPRGIDQSLSHSSHSTLTTDGTLSARHLIELYYNKLIIRLWGILRPRTMTSIHSCTPYSSCIIRDSIFRKIKPYKTPTTI